MSTRPHDAGHMASSSEPSHLPVAVQSLQALGSRSSMGSSSVASPVTFMGNLAGFFHHGPGSSASSSAVALPTTAHAVQGGDGSVQLSARLLWYSPRTGPLPPGRWNHAACALPNGRLLVHGGIGTSVLSDLHVLNTAAGTWTALSPKFDNAKDKPGEVMGHTMVPLHCGIAGATMEPVVWVFGGQQGRKVVSKLYSCSYTGTWLWRRHTSAELPAARAGHAMVATGANTAVLFGGQGNKLLNDMWTLSVNHPAMPGPLFQPVQQQGRLPIPRRGHTLTWDSFSNELILFGGTTDSGICNELHIFSQLKREWSSPQTTGSAPSSRTQHSAVLIAPHTLLVFGGCNARGVFFGDAQILDLSSMSWHTPSGLNPGPPPRYHHSCCLAGDRVAVIYGGINSKCTFDSVVIAQLKWDHELQGIAEELSAMMAASNGQQQVQQAHSTELVSKSPMDGWPSVLAQVSAGSAVTSNTSLLSIPPDSGANHLRSSSSLHQFITSNNLPHLLYAQPSTNTSVSVRGEPANERTMTDLMRVQLSDLLIKRNMSEQQQQAYLRVEALESALNAEHVTCAILQRDLAAAQLLASEPGVHGNVQWQARCTVAETALQRERAAAFSTQTKLLQLQSELERQQSELVSARNQQEGLAKELGILSSRYNSLLQVEHRKQGPCSLPNNNKQAFSPSAGVLASPSVLLQGCLSNPTCQRLLVQSSFEPTLHSCTLPPLTQHNGNAWGSEQLLGLRSYSSEHMGQPLLSPPSSPSTSLPTGANEQRLWHLPRLLPHPVSNPANQQPEPPEISSLQRANAELTQALASAQAAQAKLEAKLCYTPEALAQFSHEELQQAEKQMELATRHLREEGVRRAVAAEVKISAAHACGVCSVAPKQVVFTCGHQLCVACSETVQHCPFCQVPIVARIRLFA